MYERFEPLSGSRLLLYVKEGNCSLYRLFETLSRRRTISINMIQVHFGGNPQPEMAAG
jgi:hypothetical protein